MSWDMKRFWRIFKVLMFSLFLVGIYAFAIWLAIRFPGDHRLAIIPMTIGMIAVTPKLIEKIKTHPDQESQTPEVLSGLSPGLWPHSSCWTFSLSILPVNSMWMTGLRILVCCTLKALTYYIKSDDNSGELETESRIRSNMNF